MKFTFQGIGSGAKMRIMLNGLAETLAGVTESVELNVKMNSGVDKEPLISKALDKEK